MKCPKCGYNSFEFHDACTKCANDLTGYKSTFGLKPIVIPPEARATMAKALMAETMVAEHPANEVDNGGDMFSFDLPDDDTSTAAGKAASSDPFNFDDEPATGQSSGFGEFSFDDEAPTTQAKAEEDAFADLLESTSQNDNPFAEAVSTAPAAAPPAAGSGGGEFDLENFSWDDTPATPAAEGTAKKPEDDFDSLFGDMDDTAKK